MERSQMFKISLLTQLMQLLFVTLKAASLNLRSNHLFSLPLRFPSCHRTLCYAFLTCWANLDRKVLPLCTQSMLIHANLQRSSRFVRVFTNILTQDTTSNIFRIENRVRGYCNVNNFPNVWKEWKQRATQTQWLSF